jgi:hypothetical protein
VREHDDREEAADSLSARRRDSVTGTALAASVNLWFALIPAAVGANQLLMSAVGWSPMSKLLDRILPAPTF